MTIDEAIKHAEEVAIEQDKLCKRYDDASGYSRSHNEAIRTTDAKRCKECAEEHRQLAEWLRELKQLKEQEFYVTTRKLSDDELKHLEEQMKKARWQLISVKQDPCDDAISRQAAINAMAKIEQDDIDEYGCAIPEGFNSDPAVEALNELPSVTPQPKTGRWVTQMIFSTKLNDEPMREYECSECGRRIRCTKSQLVNYPYCHCGAKMEVEE